MKKFVPMIFANSGRHFNQNQYFAKQVLGYSSEKYLSEHPAERNVIINGFCVFKGDDYHSPLIFVDIESLREKYNNDTLGTSKLRRDLIGRVISQIETSYELHKKEFDTLSSIFFGKNQEEQNMLKSKGTEYYRNNIEKFESEIYNIQ